MGLLSQEGGGLGLVNKNVSGSPVHTHTIFQIRPLPVHAHHTHRPVLLPHTHSPQWPILSVATSIPQINHRLFCEAFPISQAEFMPLLFIFVKQTKS